MVFSLVKSVWIKKKIRYKYQQAKKRSYKSVWIKQIFRNMHVQGKKICFNKNVQIKNNIETLYFQVKYIIRVLGLNKRTFRNMYLQAGNCAKEMSGLYITGHD